MQLAANLSWMYPDMEWADRFAAAARDGFRAVEILMPYDAPPSWYGEQLRTHGLELVLFNTPVTPDAGRLGLAAVEGAQALFREQFARALDLAQATGCRRIHCMAGHVAAQDATTTRAVLLHNLEHALALATRDGITLMLEPLNHHDVPGYCYQLPAQVLELVRHFDTPHLRLQFDFYHCAREGLDPLQAVRDAAGCIGHVQIAGAPPRNEPDLALDGLLDAVCALPAAGYDSWLACEYRPAVSAAQGLGWCAPLRERGVLP